ncbi:MAG TPA: DUF222 domain-containing protein [Actinophytocola sp.]|uniref:HNH endonuclease signature motif containing protein n=1 Tax=Actinophytocola sp. TaxID=1872138 RepID=UPI002DDD1D21|nr:DUF222 domain-containing protein [Actinophytocola sp.]HEV2783698.1 DUF222 domain-containing protein [Actinophytocola sp.]
MSTTLGILSKEQQLLHQLQALDRQRSAIEAERLRLLAEYQKLRAQEGDIAERSTADEIGLALHISRDYAAAQLHLATDLTERLPATWDALHAGQVDLAKARALVELTALMSIEDTRAVEAKVLPKAQTRTLAQVRAAARYHRDRIDPQAAERRRQRATVDRTSTYEPLDDGAAELTLTGPGDQIYLAWLVLDTLARRIKAAGDDRTLAQLRHDIHLDLILGKLNERVQVHAYLHVPATTLAGIGNDPGILAGYGPVTAQACQELASGNALWRRVFTDPVTGTVKEVDRRTYRPPDGLAEFVQVRDHTCVGPGCTRPAQYCQTDHTINWANGGCTVDDNLGPLCWRDHRLKHLCQWSLQQPEPGRYVWISPVGQRHEVTPESLLDP